MKTAAAMTAAIRTVFILMREPIHVSRRNRTPSIASGFGRHSVSVMKGRKKEGGAAGPESPPDGGR
jgi:hypothetical protein